MNCTHQTRRQAPTNKSAEGAIFTNDGRSPSKKQSHPTRMAITKDETLQLKNSMQSNEYYQQSKV